MKLIAKILLVYLSLMVTSPVVCGMYQSMSVAEYCCKSDGDKCSKEEPNDKKSGDSGCTAPCSVCFSCQNCVVYFNTPLEFDFQYIEISKAQKLSAKNDKINSTYITSCWNPPEVIGLG